MIVIEIGHFLGTGMMNVSLKLIKLSSGRGTGGSLYIRCFLYSKLVVLHLKKVLFSKCLIHDIVCAYKELAVCHF